MMMTSIGTALLVVDDHPDTTAMLLRAASRRGIDGDAVLSGNAALRRLETFRPRVVVLDEMMPDMSGIDVLREIRANPALADVRVVFYSACYDWQRQRDAYALGIDHWFVKGVDRLDAVFNKIEECLQG